MILSASLVVLVISMNPQLALFQALASPVFRAESGVAILLDLLEGQQDVRFLARIVFSIAADKGEVFRILRCTSSKVTLIDGCRTMRLGTRARAIIPGAMAS